MCKQNKEWVYFCSGRIEIESETLLFKQSVLAGQYYLYSSLPALENEEVELPVPHGGISPGFYLFVNYNYFRFSQIDIN